MSRKKLFKNSLTTLVIAFFLSFIPQISFSEGKKQLCSCMDMGDGKYCPLSYSGYRE